MLTVGNPYYAVDRSRLGGLIAAGTPLYDQITATNYGAVHEADKLDGGVYGGAKRSAKPPRNMLRRSFAISQRERPI